MICPQCNNEFIKSSNASSNAQKYCSKECIKVAKKESLKKYYQTDLGKKTNRRGSLKYSRSVKGKEAIKKYKQSDKYKLFLKTIHKKDSAIESKKKYRNRNIEKIKLREKIHRRKKRETDPEYKLIGNVRSRLGDFLKSTNMRKTNKTFIMVGCTPKFLKEYLEKQFKLGMTWQNYGITGWHIDHIIPLSSAKTSEDVEKLMHYKNLQPMWAIENIRKGDKY